MKILFCLFLTLPLTSYALEKVELSETLLRHFIEEKPPSIQQIETSFLTAQQNQLAKEDNLGFRLEGEGQIYRSDERLLNSFDGGVTRSSTSYSLGIVKPTRYGVDVSVKAFGNKVTNAFVADAATNGASVSLSVDLFQNFLGRQTDNDLKKTAFSLKRAELEKKASIKAFESNLRKLYWSLVANREQKELLSSLVVTAKKQYEDRVKKRKSGVADAGEVARFRSQWSSRKADLLALNYQEGEILKSMKQLLPDLNGKKVSLGNYNVQKTAQDVLSCTAIIDSYVKAPLQHTVYDDIVTFLEKEEALERKMLKSYDGPQIKLVGEYSTVGRGFGFNESRQDFTDDAQPRTSIALQFSMPLGKGKKKTKEIAQMVNKSRYVSEARANLAKVNAFHSETVYLIKTLREVLKSQDDTNKYIEQSLRISRKKYKQARIGLEELISEQDSLLRSQLSKIDSNLTIIHTLIDYFSIYNDIPCPFNKI